MYVINYKGQIENIKKNNIINNKQYYSLYLKKLYNITFENERNKYLQSFIKKYKDS